MFLNGSCFDTLHNKFREMRCCSYVLYENCQKQLQGGALKQGVLKNLAKFKGKHLCQSFFSNKVEDLRSATLLKKRLRHRCFHVNLTKFLKTLTLKNI